MTTASGFQIIAAQPKIGLCPNSGDLIETWSFKPYTFGPNDRPEDAYFQWHGQMGCFVTGKGAVMGGITKVLAALFWPNYESKQATKGEKKEQKGDGIPYTIAQKHLYYINRPLHQHASPMDLGTRVDRELEEVAARLKKGSMTTELFLAGFFPNSLPVKEGDQWAKMRNSYHPYTLMVLEYFHRNDLRPEYGQVPVGMELIRRATGADMICVDRFGRKYFFEIKTGFNKSYDRHTGKRMMAPFSDFYDSPRNQHQVQTMVTSRFFEYTFRMGLASSTILLVNKTGVTPIDPDPTIWARWPQVFRKLQENIGSYTKVPKAGRARQARVAARGKVQRRKTGPRGVVKERKPWLKKRKEKSEDLM